MTDKKVQRDGRGRFVRGMVPWNKGKRCQYLVGNQYSVGNKPNKTSFKKGHKNSKNWYKGREIFVPWNKGKRGYHVHTEERKNELREKFRVYNPMRDDPLVRLKVSERLTGRKFTDERRKCHKKQWESMKGRKLSEEYIKKALRKRSPSSLERKFQGISDRYDLPYKYVGNGGVFVERKNPDFVNTTGEKIAIEVFNRRHKNQFRGGYLQWMNEREEIFKKNNWEIIFFSEVEINDENVLKVLGGC